MDSFEELKKIDAVVMLYNLANEIPFKHGYLLITALWVHGGSM
jgi:hypothetical protein